MRTFLLLFLVFLSFPAYAQETKEAFCKRLEGHKQDHPQGADYVPGVDVHGNPVVPADMNRPAQGFFDPVIIPIEIDLVSRYGLSVPSGVELKPEVARFEIYRDGRVIYNGQDITQRVSAICQTQDGDEAKTGLQEHGQEPVNTVPSAFERWENGKDVIKGSYPDNGSEKSRYNN